MKYNIDKENVKAFVLAGNSLFTLQSGNTGRYFTYKIKKVKDEENKYFIYRLSDSDNTKDYVYIGIYFTDTHKFYAVKPYCSRPRFTWPPSIKTVEYFLDKLDNLPNNLHVLHHGRCARCGRLLTTPDSIKKGLGPECAKR